MKSFIKLFFMIFFFCASLCVGFSYAMDGDIYLHAEEVVTLKIPETNNVVLTNSTQNSEITSQKESEELGAFHPEDDIVENKLGTFFVNFVNNRVVNNKINLFSANLGREHNARAP